MGSWRLYPPKWGGQWGTRGSPKSLGSDCRQHPRLCGAGSWPHSWLWTGSWGGAGMCRLLLLAVAGLWGWQAGGCPGPTSPGASGTCPGSGAQASPARWCVGNWGGRAGGRQGGRQPVSTPCLTPGAAEQWQGRQRGAGKCGRNDRTRSSHLRPAPARAQQTPSYWHSPPDRGYVCLPHGSLPHSSCPPSQPPGPSLPKLFFPSLEGNGSEAQVSKVEKQLLPPVLLHFPIPADSAHTGWEAGADRGHHSGSRPAPRATPVSASPL